MNVLDMVIVLLSVDPLDLITDTAVLQQTEHHVWQHVSADSRAPPKARHDSHVSMCHEVNRYEPLKLSDRDDECAGSSHPLFFSEKDYRVFANTAFIRRFVLAPGACVKYATRTI